MEVFIKDCKCEVPDTEKEKENKEVKDDVEKKREKEYKEVKDDVEKKLEERIKKLEEYIDNLKEEEIKELEDGNRQLKNENKQLRSENEMFEKKSDEQQYKLIRFIHIAFMVIVAALLLLLFINQNQQEFNWSNTIVACLFLCVMIIWSIMIVVLNRKPKERDDY